MMIQEIGFYHLERSGLEETLFRLLSKIHAQEMRVVVQSGADAARVEDLAEALWRIGEGSFLPHGTAKDGQAEQQPIWLTHQAENPNQATVLLLVDGAPTEQVTGFSRCCLIFDGRDPQQLSHARQEWKNLKTQALPLSYWKETPKGGWEKQAL